MSVFSEITRSDYSDMRQFEPLFHYLDRSAAPLASYIRTTLEEWLLNYPLDGRPDIRKRIRTGDDHQLQSTFFELMLHQLLVSLVCDVTVHPDLKDVDKHPEFLIEKSGSSCYLEATVAKSRNPLEPNRNEQKVLKDLNQLRHDHFRIAVEMEGNLSSTLPKARVQRPFNNLINNSDPQKVRELFESGRRHVTPFERIEDGDWVLEGYLVPRSSNIQTEDNGGRIAFLNKAAFMDFRGPVIRALKRKAKRYGKPSFPFIIAICSMDSFFHGRDAEMGVLFGQEVHFPDSFGFCWMNDGFWAEEDSKRVTGVWFFHGTDVLNLFSQPKEASSILYLNPRQCENPLPEWLAQFPGAKLVGGRNEGHVVLKEGIKVSDILGV